MFNQIFKEHVQVRGHPESYTFAVPELLSYREHKRVVQMENNCHKNLMFTGLEYQIDIMSFSVFVYCGHYDFKLCFQKLDRYTNGKVYSILLH